LSVPRARKFLSSEVLEVVSSVFGFSSNAVRSLPIRGELPFARVFGVTPQYEAAYLEVPLDDFNVISDGYVLFK
jgi:hypothetical protein